MSAVMQEQPTTSTALEVHAPSAPRDVAVMPGFTSSASWELAQRVAKAFASSSLVPEIYRGPQGVANCLIALEMANRMGASPLLVMQNLYVVHGNPSWSAKFLIATFNQNGRFSALRYEWNKTRTECRAWAIEKASGDRLDGPLVSVEMAQKEGWSTKNGSKWKSMPELMLMYRAATFFVRAYAPELSMGLQTIDELEDIGVTGPQSASLGAVRAAIDATPAAQTVDPHPKSYALFAEQILSASDADTATLALDEARDVLDAELQADLAEVYRRKWGEA